MLTNWRYTIYTRPLKGEEKDAESIDKPGR